MADEKKDDITAFAKARLQDPSPRKARRQGRHRNSHSTTAVPELWLRVSERRADHFEEDCEVEGDSARLVTGRKRGGNPCLFKPRRT